MRATQIQPDIPFYSSMNQVSEWFCTIDHYFVLAAQWQLKQNNDQ